MHFRFSLIMAAARTQSLVLSMRHSSFMLGNALTSTVMRRKLNPFRSISFSTTFSPRPLTRRKISDVFTSTTSCGRNATSRLASISTTSMFIKDKELINNMLFRIRKCNHISQRVQDSLLDFVIDGSVVGKTTDAVAKCLCNASPSSKPIFEISTTTSNTRVVTLTEAAGSTLESRSEAIMSVMINLRSQGLITGWRDELLPLSKGFYDAPLALVERAGAGFLGMQQYGVHINGFVRSPDDDESGGSGVGEERMWMARRSVTKSKYPGMLDHIVAGGQPAGLGLMENVLKECMEEAGITEDVTRKGIQAAGAISYEGFEDFNTSGGGGSTEIDGFISRSVLFCYDLELPPDFVPDAVDGEVGEFFQWSIEEVIESMHNDYYDPIKPNCYLVIIDFLLRRGHISPEVPGYLDVLRELRSGYCG
mmetsp:Transcript_16489/g.19564  ORF Transcript_16489/g.19564 Transcript_16489/m.19564 type:complete len:422 (+) Transcript_16489:31-1296(+)